MLGWASAPPGSRTSRVGSDIEDAMAPVVYELALRLRYWRCIKVSPAS